MMALQEQSAEAAIWAWESGEVMICKVGFVFSPVLSLAHRTSACIYDDAMK